MGRIAIRVLTIASALVLGVLGVAPGAAVATEDRPVGQNQTEGFAQGQLARFTYSMAFHCTVEPDDDLDGPGHRGDGEPAAVDPEEMVAPPCIVGDTGSGSLPQQDPAGRPVPELAGDDVPPDDVAERFWALLPFFDEDGDGVPDLIDPTPGIPTQCPEPGPPTTEHEGRLGTCTMHPATAHIEPITDLVIEQATGLGVPVGDLVAAGDTVIPNHSHIVQDLESPPVWWQAIVVFVYDPAVFPDLDGRCEAGPPHCLTSLDALRRAQADGRAEVDIPTNLWLFFAVEPSDALRGEGGDGQEHGQEGRDDRGALPLDPDVPLPPDTDSVLPTTATSAAPMVTAGGAAGAQPAGDGNPWAWLGLVSLVLVAGGLLRRRATQ